MFTLDELTTPLTSDQVKTKIYTAIAAMGVDTTVWKPGAVTRTMIAAFSIVVAACSTLVASVARGGFLELAEDAWLALKAKYDYGVDKVYAQFAAGEVTLVNTGGGVFSFDAGDVVFGNTSTGKTYRNTGAFNLAALATITIPIAADEAGEASTSAPGTITTLVTPLTGVTVSNATAVIGRDAESDPELRTRCAEKLGSLSPNGPWDAFSFAARGARRQDGTLVGVNRVRVKKDGFGNVSVYVASASGAVTGTRTDPSTDLGAVDAAIQKNAATITDTASAISAAPVSIAVTYTAYLYNTSGLTQAQILARIAAALVEFMRGQPIGGNVVGADPGKVFVDAVRTAIGAALPQIFHVVVTVPVADVALTIGQVPVLGTVTGHLVQSPPSEGTLV